MKINSITHLIDQWSTIGDFATDLGCGYEAARKMRSRNAIAPKYWSTLISICRDKGVQGVTYEWLATFPDTIQEPAE